MGHGELLDGVVIYRNALSIEPMFHRSADLNLGTN